MSRVGPCDLLSVRSQAATCHELWEIEVRPGPEEDCVCGRGQKVGWTLAMVLLGSRHLLASAPGATPGRGSMTALKLAFCPLNAFSLPARALLSPRPRPVCPQGALGLVLAHAAARTVPAALSVSPFTLRPLSPCAPVHSCLPTRSLASAVPPPA